MNANGSLDATIIMQLEVKGFEYDMGFPALLIQITTN